MYRVSGLVQARVHDERTDSVTCPCKENDLFQLRRGGNLFVKLLNTTAHELVLRAVYRYVRTLQAKYHTSNNKLVCHTQISCYFQSTYYSSHRWVSAKELIKNDVG